MGPPGRCSREFGMKWRVMLELVGPDGIVCVHEVCGRAAVAEYAPQMIGLSLEEGKHLLAALQVHLVQAQAEDHSRRRRRCQRCGAQRPSKISAPGGWCPCSARWRSARRALPRVGVR
jgi:hypothetical protein